MQVTSTVVMERLAAACTCSGCGASFDPRDVHVLARHGDRSWELAAVCRRCCTLSLFRAFVCHRPSRYRWAPSRDELGDQERQRFRAMPPVDHSDVRQATEFLAAFDGDFRQLFDRPRFHSVP